MCDNIVALDDQIQLEKMYKESVSLQVFYVYVRVVTRCSCQGLTRDLCAMEFWEYRRFAMCYDVDTGEKQRGTIF